MLVLSGQTRWAAKMVTHGPCSPGLTIVDLNLNYTLYTPIDKLGCIFMKVIKLFGTFEGEDKTQQAQGICLQVFERLSCG